MLGYFPARRPCVRVRSVRSSLTWALVTAEQWHSEGAARVQLQKRGTDGRRVLSVEVPRLLIVPVGAGSERFPVSR